MATNVIISDDYRAVHPAGTLHPPKPTAQEIGAATIDQYSLAHLQAVPIGQEGALAIYIAEVVVSSGRSPVTVKFAFEECVGETGG